MVSFFGILVLLLILIITGNFLRQKKPAAAPPKKPVKTVRIYRIGTAPRVRFQAQVEKSGVIQINALAGGVVQAIHTDVGKIVGKGKTLISLSTNYQGGNLLTLQRVLAETQLKNVEDNYETQKDTIGKQRELAEKQKENADDLREITQQSLDETRSLISLNDEILSTLNENLDQFIATNSAGINKASILATRQLKSTYQSANNSLKSALRNAEYNTDEDNPPSQIADLQKEVALKQLEVQEKAIDLNRDVTRLQAQIARVNEGLMFPAAPFSATVQRIFVKIGQAVQPGTPLIVLSQSAEEDPIVAIAYVPHSIAKQISTLEPSTLHIGKISYSAYPSYITQDAIQGTLYGVYFPIPDNYHSMLTEKGYIEVDIPVGYFDTNAAVPFIPIDAVYQSQEDSYIFVAKNGIVASKKIQLGTVYGSYVEVKEGLSAGDQVILDRNVTTGDKVKIQ